MRFIFKKAASVGDGNNFIYNKVLQGGHENNSME